MKKKILLPVVPAPRAQEPVKRSLLPAAGAEKINHPQHYCSHPSGVEAITIAEHMTFNVGSAIKYLFRAGLKPDCTTIEDLRKSAWYINREIERLGKQGT